MKKILTTFVISLFAVVAFGQQSTPELLKNKELFEQVTVIMNASRVLEVAMDKGETARYLLQNGVKTPKTWYTVEEAELAFPMIVKEKTGCGSHSVFVVKDSAQLQEKFDGMDAPIVQEYVGDSSEEYTLTVFSDGKVVNYIAFRRELGFGGMSRYVELVIDSGLAEVSRKIADMFELKGSVNVQMRKCNGDYYVFEINPRISSTVGFRTALGFNDVSWWLDLYEGNTVQEYEYPKEKVYGARTVEEKIFYA